jgi:UDP-N-acetylglucosamine acyltransferase
LIVTERETRCFGTNTIGLERKGFSEERIKALQRAFKLLVRSKKNTTQALEELRETMAESEDVRELIAFAEKAERGIVK